MCIRERGNTVHMHIAAAASETATAELRCRPLPCAPPGSVYTRQGYQFAGGWTEGVQEIDHKVLGLPITTSNIGQPLYFLDMSLLVDLSWWAQVLVAATAVIAVAASAAAHAAADVAAAHASVCSVPTAASAPAPAYG